MVELAELSLTSVFVQMSGKVSADLSGEVAILDPDKGFYYGLNTVGARIWELLATPKSLEEVRGGILEEYEVEAEQCTIDLLQLVADLERHRLVERK